MKLMLAALTLLSLPLTAQAEGLPVAADYEDMQANYTTDAGRVEIAQPETRHVERAEYGPAPGTLGHRRCRNLEERIKDLSHGYREDSDESLRSLGFEGPNAQRGRTIRELREEQARWGCFEKREEQLRCDRLAADLKTTLRDLQSDAVETFNGRKIPGRKERLEHRLEKIRIEGQELGCRVAGEF